MPKIAELVIMIIQSTDLFPVIEPSQLMGSHLKINSSVRGAMITIKKNTSIKLMPSNLMSEGSDSNFDLTRKLIIGSIVRANPIANKPYINPTLILFFKCSPL